MREHNIQNIAHLSYYTNANGLLLVVLKKRGSANFSLQQEFTQRSHRDRQEGHQVPSTGQLQTGRQQDGATQRWNLRHPRGGGATDSCLRGEACRRHGPLGWSGDSLSAQARPGVALHSHAPLLPHPCVPQPGLHTCRHRQ